MRKFVLPLPAGGAPLTTERLNDVMTTEQWKVIEGMMQQIVDPAATGNVGVIISGVKATANGGNWDVSAGIVYMAGTFMEFPGFTNVAFPRYILPATLVTTQKPFADGVARDLFTQQDATHQSGVPGAGQYITLSTTGNNGGPGGLRIENANLSDWVSSTIVAADITRTVGGTAASSVNGTSRVEYRITKKETLINVLVKDAAWAATTFNAGDGIYVVMPTAVRPMLQSELAGVMFMPGIALVNQYKALAVTYVTAANALDFRMIDNGAFGANPTVSLGFGMTLKFIS